MAAETNPKAAAEALRTAGDALAEARRALSETGLYLGATDPQGARWDAAWAGLELAQRQTQELFAAMANR